MKEYGGYIEFEYYSGSEYHDKSLDLNCGRNCLAYLFKTKGIHKIYLPYFICSSVTDVCNKYQVEFEFYHIDSNFRPVFNKSLKLNEYLYVVNYYGQLNNDYISILKNEFSNLIIDNAQAFFQMPVKNVDTLYTCRKFFGVSDGAYLYTKDASLNIDVDYSYDRMNFLLGRFEKTANEFYSEYVDNNHLFRNEDIKHMSKLTHNLLKGLDYEKIKNVRTNNFLFLHNQFKGLNKLCLVVPEGAFMYPLYVDNGKQIRKVLQSKKIYIPTLWPDVFNVCSENDLEYKFSENILPIPVDQRYGEEDMDYLVQEVMKCLNSEN